MAINFEKIEERKLRIHRRGGETRCLVKPEDELRRKVGRCVAKAWIYSTEQTQSIKMVLQTQSQISKTSAAVKRKEKKERPASPLGERRCQNLFILRKHLACSRVWITSSRMPHHVLIEHQCIWHLIVLDSMTFDWSINQSIHLFSVFNFCISFLVEQVQADKLVSGICTRFLTTRQFFLSLVATCCSRVSFGFQQIEQSCFKTLLVALTHSLNIFSVD